MLEVASQAIGGLNAQNYRHLTELNIKGTHAYPDPMIRNVLSSRDDNSQIRNGNTQLAQIINSDTALISWNFENEHSLLIGSIPYR